MSRFDSGDDQYRVRLGWVPPVEPPPEGVKPYHFGIIRGRFREPDPQRLTRWGAHRIAVAVQRIEIATLNEEYEDIDLAMAGIPYDPVDVTRSFAHDLWVMNPTNGGWDLWEQQPDEDIQVVSQWPALRSAHVDQWAENRRPVGLQITNAQVWGEFAASTIVLAPRGGSGKGWPAVGDGWTSTDAVDAWNRILQTTWLSPAPASTKLMFVLPAFGMPQRVDIDHGIAMPPISAVTTVGSLSAGRRPS